MSKNIYVILLSFIIGCIPPSSSIPGPKGDIGPRGPIGVQGPKGDKGPKGNNGESVPSELLKE